MSLFMTMQMILKMNHLVIIQNISDSDTGGTSEAAEDSLEAGSAGCGASRELLPVLGPSTSGQHQSVVSCSRGKRLPWRDTDYNDYNDTNDCEEDKVRGPDPTSNSRESEIGHICHGHHHHFRIKTTVRNRK